MFPEACNLWQASAAGFKMRKGLGRVSLFPFAFFLHVRATLRATRATILTRSSYSLRPTCI